MKPKLKSQLITLAIIIAIILISYFSLALNSETKTTEEVAICIGENAILYIQLGCSHCETQKELFGEYVDHLTIVDCFYEGEKCPDIKYTPTWKINNELITGLQEIDKLRELTKC